MPEKHIRNGKNSNGKSAQTQTKSSWIIRTGFGMKKRECGDIKNTGTKRIRVKIEKGRGTLLLPWELHGPGLAAFGSLSGADPWLPAIPRTKCKNPLGSVGELRGLRLSGLFLGAHDIRQFTTAFTTPAWKSYGNRGERLVIFWGDFLLVFLRVEWWQVSAPLLPQLSHTFWRGKGY